MNKVFEKIIEKLEDAKSNVPVNRLLDDIIKDKPKELGQLMAYNKAIEIVKQEAEQYNNGWISVKETLPEKAGSYLVIGKSGGAVVTRWYEPSKFYPNGHFGGNCSNYIRYWMPRPEPPQTYQPKGE